MNKYYTPKVEDLHIGYECELFSSLTGEWCEKKIENIVDYILCMNSIHAELTRTAYLTREDIEKEGWKVLKIQYRWTEFEFTKYPSWRLYVFEGVNHQVVNNCHFHFSNCGYYKNTSERIQGCTPSINEFRTICKLLHII